MPAQPSDQAGTHTQPADLTWLLHRAAQRMRAALDLVAIAHGLAGVRDWIVLSALIAQPGRTQLALGHALGLDKTTLTSLLDRLETGGLIIRSLDPHDGRARIPQVTTAGRRTQARITDGSSWLQRRPTPVDGSVSYGRTETSVSDSARFQTRIWSMSPMNQSAGPSNKPRPTTNAPDAPQPGLKAVVPVRWPST